MWGIIQISTQSPKSHGELTSELVPLNTPVHSESLGKIVGLIRTVPVHATFPGFSPPRCAFFVCGEWLFLSARMKVILSTQEAIFSQRRERRLGPIMRRHSQAPRWPRQGLCSEPSAEIVHNWDNDATLSVLQRRREREREKCPHLFIYIRHAQQVQPPLLFARTERRRSGHNVRKRREG